MPQVRRFMPRASRRMVSRPRSRRWWCPRRRCRSWPRSSSTATMAVSMPFQIHRVRAGGDGRVAVHDDGGGDHRRAPAGRPRSRTRPRARSPRPSLTGDRASPSKLGVTADAGSGLDPPAGEVQVFANRSATRPRRRRRRPALLRLVRVARNVRARRAGEHVDGDAGQRDRDAGDGCARRGISCGTGSLEGLPYRVPPLGKGVVRPRAFRVSPLGRGVKRNDRTKG